MKNTFYYCGAKCHIVKVIEDCGKVIVVHKHWSKRNQVRRYNVDSERLVLMLQQKGRL